MVNKKLASCMALLSVFTLTQAPNLSYAADMNWLESSLHQENGEMEADVTAHFSALNEQLLTVTASSSNAGVITAAASGTTVHFEPKTSGAAVLTVEGDDGTSRLTDRFQATVTKLGDSNGDGLITPADVLFVYQVINGKVTVTEIQKKALDMNGDGVLTAADASLMMKTYTSGSSGQSLAPKFVVEWSNVNDAPVLISAPDPQQAVTDEEYSWTLPENTFADIDEADALTHSASLENGQPLPNWLTFDETNQTFHGTPAESGALKVKVTATDAENETAETIIDFTIQEKVVNQAPEVTGQVPEQLAVLNVPGESIDLSSLFSDPDNDSLTFTAVSLDESIAAAAVNGSAVAIQPAGIGRTKLKVIASDGKASAETYIDVRSVEVVPGGWIDVTTKQGVSSVVVDISPYFPQATAIELRSNGVSSALSGKVVTYLPGAAGTEQIWVISSEHQAVRITIHVVAQTGSSFFFSEYLDGGNGRIALEIYNSSSEKTAGYTLEAHLWDQTAGKRTVHSGSLFDTWPGNTYNIINSTFYDYFDLTSAWYYNEEWNLWGPSQYPVAFVLKKNGQVMDVIGDPNGTGPAPIFMNGGTITRKLGIRTGSGSFQLLGEWDRYPSGTFQFMGRHTP